MEAVIPMNKFMELTEEDLMVVDGGGPMLAAYPVDWGGLLKEVGKGFLYGTSGAVATGAGQHALQAGIVGAIVSGIGYYIDHPWPTYFLGIY